MVCDNFLNLLTAFSFLSLLWLQLDKKGIAVSKLSAKPIGDRQSQSLIKTSEGCGFLQRIKRVGSRKVYLILDYSAYLFLGENGEILSNKVSFRSFKESRNSVISSSTFQVVGGALNPLYLCT